MMKVWKNPSMHMGDTAETTSRQGRMHTHAHTHADGRHENIIPAALPNSGGGIIKNG